MYELWLTLNIAWELLVMYRMWTLPAVLVLVVLLTLALWRHSRAGMRPLFLIVSAIGAVVAYFGLLWETMAELGDLGYWVDWIVLGAISLGVGVIAGIAAAGIYALMAKPAAE